MSSRLTRQLREQENVVTTTSTPAVPRRQESATRAHLQAPDAADRGPMFVNAFLGDGSLSLSAGAKAERWFAATSPMKG